MAFGLFGERLAASLLHEGAERLGSEKKLALLSVFGMINMPEVLQRETVLAEPSDVIV